MPDCVKELQVFDGNPVQYTSWIHNVDSILKDYEIVRSKPIYRAILQAIRQKIRGKADSALISYNIFDDDWSAIKKCLSLHYADKRDIATLEHQLNQITQRNMSIDEFYANVNHQFSLIINKIKTEDYTQETIKVLIETYRNRALDIFIRGLNGDLSRMLIIQKPQTLPEAYSSCLQIQNSNFRNLRLHKRDFSYTVTSPINQISTSNLEPARPHPKSISIPIQQRNKGYHIQHQQNRYQPQRPTQPKPPVPMEIDRSIQSRQVDYMNRLTNNHPMKRFNTSDDIGQKHQRIYNLETQEKGSYEEYMEHCTDAAEDELDQEFPEVNFMTEASLAFPT